MVQAQASKMTLEAFLALPETKPACECIDTVLPLPLLCPTTFLP